MSRHPGDRDAISSNLLRYRDPWGDDWADIIDSLTMHPEARRNVARVARGDRRRVKARSLEVVVGASPL